MDNKETTDLTEFKKLDPSQQEIIKAIAFKDVLKSPAPTPAENSLFIDKQKAYYANLKVTDPQEFDEIIKKGASLIGFSGAFFRLMNAKGTTKFIKNH